MVYTTYKWAVLVAANGSHTNTLIEQSVLMVTFSIAVASPAAAVTAVYIFAQIYRIRNVRPCIMSCSRKFCNKNFVKFIKILNHGNLELNRSQVDSRLYVQL